MIDGKIQFPIEESLIGERQPLVTSFDLSEDLLCYFQSDAPIVACFLTLLFR